MSSQLQLPKNLSHFQRFLHISLKKRETETETERQRDRETERDRLTETERQREDPKTSRLFSA